MDIQCVWVYWVYIGPWLLERNQKLFIPVLMIRTWVLLFIYI